MVAVNVLYRVGARDEEAERTGFAHLFEHLMFGGSVNAPDYDEVAQQIGAENNAFTSNDLTNYYLKLPAANLETALWLEADRMANLDISERPLEVQRQVVVEEFKQRYLNQPYGDAWLKIRPMAYKNHPYQWATIGKSIAHIEEATLSEVSAFYAKHYSPNNAIVSVVGGIDPENAFALVEKYFGAISSTGERNTFTYPTEAERLIPEEEHVEANVPSNAFYFAWQMPERLSPDFHAADMVTDVLSRGNSSRLYQRLVKNEQLVSEISAYASGDFGPGLIIIQGKPHPGITFEQVEASLLAEINRLQTEPIPDHELEKVKNQYEASTVGGETSILNTAMSLCFAEMLGDPEMVNTDMTKYRAVTAEQVQAQARKLLTPEKRVALYYKATKAGASDDTTTDAKSATNQLFSAE